MAAAAAATETGSVGPEAQAVAELHARNNAIAAANRGSPVHAAALDPKPPPSNVAATLEALVHGISSGQIRLPNAADRGIMSHPHPDDRDRFSPSEHRHPAPPADHSRRHPVTIPTGHPPPPVHYSSRRDHEMNDPHPPAHAQPPPPRNPHAMPHGGGGSILPPPPVSQGHGGKKGQGKSKTQPKAKFCKNIVWRKNG